MTRWVGLLRGVNLGKRQMKMAELKSALESSGFAEVKTVLASGNFLATKAGNEHQIKSEAEAVLKSAFDFPIEVVLRGLPELQALAASAPFASLNPEDDLTKHVLFLDQPLPGPVELVSRPRDTEILHITAREIMIAAYRQPNGRYTENVEEVLKPLYAVLGKARLSTMRNWNTIEKLLS